MDAQTRKLAREAKKSALANDQKGFLFSLSRMGPVLRMTEGESPLFQLCAQSNPELARSLFSLFPWKSLSARDFRDRSVFCECAAFGTPEVLSSAYASIMAEPNAKELFGAELLLPDSNGHCALFEIARQFGLKKSLFFLKTLAPEQLQRAIGLRTWRGDNFLGYCAVFCKNDTSSAFRELVSMGFGHGRFEATQKGYTPLLSACWEGNKAAVEALAPLLSAEMRQDPPSGLAKVIFDIQTTNIPFSSSPKNAAERQAKALFGETSDEDGLGFEDDIPFGEIAPAVAPQAPLLGAQGASAIALQDPETELSASPDLERAQAMAHGHLTASHQASPAHICAWRGHAELLPILKQSGHSLSSLDGERNNPLLCAALAGQTQAVEYLLQEDPQGLNCSNKSGFTPLMAAAAKAGGAPELFRALLRRSPDANARSAHPWHSCAMESALRHAPLWAAQELLAHGANLLKSPRKRTGPFEAALGSSIDPASKIQWLLSLNAGPKALGASESATLNAQDMAYLEGGSEQRGDFEAWFSRLENAAPDPLACPNDPAETPDPQEEGDLDALSNLHLSAAKHTRPVESRRMTLPWACIEANSSALEALLQWDQARAESGNPFFGMPDFHRAWLDCAAKGRFKALRMLEQAVRARPDLAGQTANPWIEHFPCFDGRFASHPANARHALGALLSSPSKKLRSRAFGLLENGTFSADDLFIPERGSDEDTAKLYFPREEAPWHFSAGLLAQLVPVFEPDELARFFALPLKHPANCAFWALSHIPVSALKTRVDADGAELSERKNPGRARKIQAIGKALALLSSQGAFPETPIDPARPFALLPEACLAEARRVWPEADPKALVIKHPKRKASKRAKDPEEAPKASDWTNRAPFLRESVRVHDHESLGALLSLGHPVWHEHHLLNLLTEHLAWPLERAWKGSGGAANDAWRKTFHLLIALPEVAKACREEFIHHQRLARSAHSILALASDEDVYARLLGAGAPLENQPQEADESEPLWGQTQERKPASALSSLLRARWPRLPLGLLKRFGAEKLPDGTPCSLLADGAGFDARFDALMCAPRSKSAQERLLSLVKTLPMDPLARAQDGGTLLSRAIGHGQIQCAEHLLAQGHSPTPDPQTGNSAFSFFFEDDKSSRRLLRHAEPSREEGARGSLSNLPVNETLFASVLRWAQGKGIDLFEREGSGSDLFMGACLHLPAETLVRLLGEPGIDWPWNRAWGTGIGQENILDWKSKTLARHEANAGNDFLEKAIPPGSVLSLTPASALILRFGSDMDARLAKIVARKANLGMMVSRSPSKNLCAADLLPPGALRSFFEAKTMAQEQERITGGSAAETASAAPRRRL